MDDASLHIIARRRQEIARELDRLRSEDEELVIAARALSRLGGQALQFADEDVPERAHRSANRSLRGGERRPSQVRRSKGAAVLSQRELVLGALSKSSDIWLETAKILAEVESQFGQRLPLASIRPLMTHLKLEGVVVRDKRRVALASRVRGEARRGGQRHS